MTENMSLLNATESRRLVRVGADGLDIYRRFSADAFKYINRDGLIFLEVGEGEAQAVAKMFRGNSYSMIVKDFNNIDRYVKIVT